jgi:hypothetical protein
MRNIALAAVLAVVASLAAAGGASAKTTWLCRPGLAENPCAATLSTTVFSSWGKRAGVAGPPRATKAKVDCFYVYPTVSDQQTDQANLRVDPELRSIALYQAARYAQYCRVFAPVYRQLTVPALSRPLPASAARSAYGDVEAAWKDYLAHDNKGRGVVLIGHSQGAAHLQRLIREQIEPRASVRRRLVSAILLGGNVTVRRGADVGGVFRRTPACRSASQIGCVIAFSTFNATPPPDTRFGGSATRFAKAFGLPSGSGYEVLCTNPAALGGGTAPLTSILPTAPFAPGTLIAAGISLLQFPVPQASTTFLQVRGAFTGHCSRAGGANVLRVESVGATPVPKPSPDPTWGLHLVDANIALGDLLGVVERQIRAYATR